VDPNLALGSGNNNEGPISAPYVIVEFGDYQCPFCRKAESEKMHLLSSTRGMVRIVFRQHPLETIHDRALAAAIASEAAAEQGRFSPMHHRLMASPLDPDSLLRSAKEAGLDLARASISASNSAHRRVIDDLVAARALHVSGTPTFFLLSPNKEVRRFDNLSHLSLFVKNSLGIHAAQSRTLDDSAGGCGPSNNKCGQ